MKENSSKSLGSLSLSKGIIKDFLFSLISMLFITWILFCAYTFFSVWKSCTQMYQPAEQEFLRIRIFGSSSSPDGNTISAEFSITDTNGNEIAAIERSWTGNYLAVEFSEVEFNDNYFLFPSKIYGKERIMQSKPQRNKSTLLEKYYNENHQCMLLGFGSSFEERNMLYKISRFATGNYLVPSFGHVTTYSLDLSNCRINTWYSIKRTADGNLVIVEI